LFALLFLSPSNVLYIEQKFYILDSFNLQAISGNASIIFHKFGMLNTFSTSRTWLYSQTLKRLDFNLLNYPVKSKVFLSF